MINPISLQARPAASSELIYVPSKDDDIGDEGEVYLLEDVVDFVRLVPPQGSRMELRYEARNGRAVRDCLVQWFENCNQITFAVSRLRRGEYHPRIWRNGIALRQLVAREALQLSVRAEDLCIVRPRAVAFHLIQRRLSDIFEVVTPGRENAAAHGSAIQQVLALSAMEVEALLRDAYRLNHSVPYDDSEMRHWFKLAAPMRLDEWEAELTRFPDWQWVRPFQNWEEHRVPSWWTANNKLKHEPEKRWKADLESAISAVCAIRILLEAEFGPGVEEFLPTTGLAGIRITKRPMWAADQMYFPVVRGEQLQAIPVLG